MSRIYLSPPDVRALEKDLIVAAIESGWVAPVGPDLEAFERETAAIAGTARAVALSSGTAALHLGLQELGVGSGDDVIVSTFTFAASANAVVYLGATPVFIDCEAASWNLCPELLAEELKSRAASGRVPKAAVVVDLYGQCADYDRVAAVLDEYEVALFEDAAEALGASYRGRPAGSFGRCAALSFNGNKIITTSGGGMLLCHDDVFADRIRHLATQAREPFPHYEHAEVGFNYRLSNLLAAFGRGQLANLAERIARRREINARYRRALEDREGIAFMPVAGYGEPNWWLTCITVDEGTLGIGREELRQHLEGDDIESRPLWKPMHLQPVFSGAPARIDGTSAALFRTGLCLPSGSGMTDNDLDRTIGRILDLIDRC